MELRAQLPSLTPARQLALLQEAVAREALTLKGARLLAQEIGLPHGLFAQLTRDDIARTLLANPGWRLSDGGTTGGTARGRITSAEFDGNPGDIPPASRAELGWTSGLPGRSEAPWFRSAALDAALDRTTSSRSVEGSAAELLINGVESQKRREENIRDADVVLLKTYNFRNDETGQRMRSQLMDRLRSGKQVFVQYDVKGYFSKQAGTIVKAALKNENPIPPEMQELLDAGAVLIPTNANSVNPVFGKDHEKYLLTWKKGETARLIMGGMNVGDEWAMGGAPGVQVQALHGAHGFRDTDCEIRGPAVERVLEESLGRSVRSDRRRSRPSRSSTAPPGGRDRRCAARVGRASSETPRRRPTE